MQLFDIVKKSAGRKKNVHLMDFCSYFANDDVENKQHWRPSHVVLSYFSQQLLMVLVENNFYWIGYVHYREEDLVIRFKWMLFGGRFELFLVYLRKIALNFLSRLNYIASGSFLPAINKIFI